MKGLSKLRLQALRDNQFLKDPEQAVLVTTTMAGLDLTPDEVRLLAKEWFTLEVAA